MTCPVIILGAGGHARVLIDLLRLQSTELLGATTTVIDNNDRELLGVRVIGNDDEVDRYPTGTISLVNGVGSVSISAQRRQIFESFKRKGYRFATAIHPSAVIAADASISEGAQVMAGAIVQSGCHIGANALINTGAVVDHDCRIGDHAHISSGATLSGGVQVGENAHVGAGATVIQGIKIGRNSLVAAGSVVIGDVPDDTIVMGVPALARPK
jgi:sugar O-acyltransferase (sialic acid O-acetyltransferase NeuD family)